VRRTDPDPDPPRRRDADEIDAIYRWYRGQAMPNLQKIPTERWEAALRPLSSWARYVAAGNAGNLGEMRHAQRIAVELDLRDLERRRLALEASAPPPPPAVERAGSRRRTRQVNFRITPDEYRDLSRAALQYGVTCPTLARMLTVRGVRRALDEA
jgi:hypothetical protein